MRVEVATARTFAKSTSPRTHSGDGLEETRHRCQVCQVSGAGKVGAVRCMTFLDNTFNFDVTPSTACVLRWRRRCGLCRRASPMSCSWLGYD
ncbi:unnamed protein product [Urochloa humidicola]